MKYLIITIFILSTSVISAQKNVPKPKAKPSDTITVMRGAVNDLKFIKPKPNEKITITASNGEAKNINGKWTLTLDRNFNGTFVYLNIIRHHGTSIIWEKKIAKVHALPEPNLNFGNLGSGTYSINQIESNLFGILHGCSQSMFFDPICYKVLSYRVTVSQPALFSQFQLTIDTDQLCNLRPYLPLYSKGFTEIFIDSITVYGTRLVTDTFLSKSTLTICINDSISHCYLINGKDTIKDNFHALDFPKTNLTCLTIEKKGNSTKIDKIWPDNNQYYLQTFKNNHPTTAFKTIGDSIYYTSLFYKNTRVLIQPEFRYINKSINPNNTHTLMIDHRPVYSLNDSLKFESLTDLKNLLLTNYAYGTGKYTLYFNNGQLLAYAYFSDTLETTITLLPCDSIGFDFITETPCLKPIGKWELFNMNGEMIENKKY